MLRRILLFSITMLAAVVLGGQTALAQGDEAILGTWESFNEGNGEFSFVTFAADGVLAVEVYDAERGKYVVDEEQQRFGWWNAGDDAADEPDWVAYQLDGDRLIVAEGEMELPLVRVWQPAEPANELAGRWKMLFDEVEGIDELREAGEEIPGAFIVDMGNNGSAMTMELSKKITGTYSLDTEAGTFEILMEDETEAGSYQIDGQRMILTVDGEELVYERTQ